MNRRMRYTLSIAAVIGAGVLAAVGIFGMTGTRSDAIPVQEPPRRVAITFDDVPATALPDCGPDAIDRVTDALLTTLEDFDIAATAFVVESRACGPNAEATLVRTLGRWLDAGHDLANHTARHSDLNTVSLNAYEKDLVRGGEVVDRLLRSRGRHLRYFRPPGLHMGDTRAKREGLARLLERRGYLLGPVTIDNQEWVYDQAYRQVIGASDEAMAARVAHGYLEHMETIFTYYERLSRDLLGREIPHVLLLHANVLNADHLRGVLQILRDRGYEFVSLDEALQDPAYALPDEYVGARGLSWLQRWALTRGMPVPAEPREAPWVASLARGTNLPRVYGFRWRHDAAWSDGRLTLLPGDRGPWGVLELPGREGSSTIAATGAAGAAGGPLHMTLGDPEGSLMLDSATADSGRLVIGDETHPIEAFLPLDDQPDPEVIALVGVEPLHPGILSTERSEEFPSFTPAGDTIYLTRGFQRVLQSTRKPDGSWSPLTDAPFGSAYRDRAARVSPDGSALYLTSNRPGPGEERAEDNRNHDLWRLRRGTDATWVDPERLPAAVNSDLPEYHASATMAHTLYFSGWDRPGGFGRSDIYRAERQGDGWAPAENLGPVINGAGSESDVFVDPLERYILFVSTDRADSRGGDDIYVSWRKDDGWTTPRNLGPTVNSPWYEYGPTVSPDERWLYFTSHRRGSADLYRVRLASVLTDGQRSLNVVAQGFRALVREGRYDAARAMMTAEPRRWFAPKDGAGQPWRIGPGTGPWAAWDAHFRSESEVISWREADRTATAMVRETNDYFRLLERGAVTSEITYIFDRNGRIEGLVIAAVGDRPPGRTEEFLRWARQHEPRELEALMPGGEIDPSGDHPERFRVLLNRWRAEDRCCTGT